MKFRIADKLTQPIFESLAREAVAVAEAIARQKALDYQTTLQRMAKSMGACLMVGLHLLKTKA